MRFIHINRNSILPKIDEVCYIANITNASIIQFVIFKPLSYCFEQTIGFDVKASFVNRPTSRLISWYNKPGDITKELWEKATQFHGTFHGLQITNWIGISKTKLDETILLSILEVDDYDLVRLDRSRRGGVIACYIKSSIAYSYKGSFCSNTKSIFVDIFLPKSNPILLGILYRPPDKSDFVKHINNVFTETGVSDKHECYLLGDLNINLILDEKEIFSNKSYKSNGQNLPPLTKGYLDFWFSFSLKQLNN